MEVLNLKIVSIFIVLFTFISSSNGESQLQTDNMIYSTNNSSVVRNIVIIIDASGSTVLGDTTTGLTFIGLIDANAINIIQNAAPDTNMGVVVYGVTTVKTDILPMGSEANRATLGSFVKEVGPKRGENPTDLDLGLRAAEKLLDSVSGSKEIIVISDGQIHPDGFDQEKNTAIDLKNKGIKMQFVQILASPETVKEPYKLYSDLAKAADGQAIVLNPDERMVIHEPTPTITPTVTTIFVPATTQIITPTPIPTSQLEQEVKELKERLNKVEEKQNQSWLESSINFILSWFKTIF